MAAHRLTTNIIASEDELRTVIGDPLPITVSKVASELTDQTRQFIERSPFVCVATTDQDGNCDVSPRGDPTGFVRVLDHTTLLIPERPGNRLADSLRNIIATGRIGLLFLIPGAGSTFRLNGHATLTTDEDLLAPSAVDGKVPKLGIIVDVEEAYTQCSKASIRSALWDPSRYIDQSDLPTFGQIMASMSNGEIQAETDDQEPAKRYDPAVGLY